MIYKLIDRQWLVLRPRKCQIRQDSSKRQWLLDIYYEGIAEPHRYGKYPTQADARQAYDAERAAADQHPADRMAFHKKPPAPIRNGR